MHNDFIILGTDERIGNTHDLVASARAIFNVLVMAKICISCGKKIPWIIIEEGIRLRITGRKFCFECSPRRHYAHPSDSWARMSYYERKALVTDKLGGKCVECGYNEFPDLFEFHHLRRSKKNRNVSKLIRESSWAKVILEIRRCLLVCPNCHKAIHMGLIDHRFKVPKIPQ